MCGIVGVVRRPSRREPPAGGELVAAMEVALRTVDTGRAVDLEALEAAAEQVAAVDARLRGVPGVRTLLADRAAAVAIEDRAARITEHLAGIEAELDDKGAPTAELEALNAALVRLKDAVWAVQHDRLRNARAVGDLAGAGASVAAIEAFTSVQVALSSIDRLEVRGRDSAGLAIVVRNHGLADADADPSVRRLLAQREADSLLVNGAVRRSGAVLAFVYKAAAEIGELGDNTAVLRAAIRADELLHLAVAPEGAEATILGHTRWASVGIISEPNAHPLDQTETGGFDAPLVLGALNGDVDNYADLEVAEGLSTAAEITTDAKVIPALVSRRLASGRTSDDAFRTTVATLEGSVAIGALLGSEPGSLSLALRGSGQALYVGLAEDAYVVASEPYGLVEETSEYLRLDGETPSDPERAGATRGQVVVIESAGAGTLEGIRRVAYDGTALPVTTADVHHAEITTRDIDRGDAPHFLYKEISEAPASFRKTLRGKVAEQADGRLSVRLPASALPDAVRARLADGSIHRLLVIGQGTAAIAGQALVGAARDLMGDRLYAEAVLATELSGFGMRADMSDTLVVAISQSGTTTDTNRSVDLVRSRGAAVLAIVNRRNSDLVDRSDGVLYTSDGRDVEMSVASTKAFYAQVAAGYLLALGIASAVGMLDADREHELLTALRALPDAMATVVTQRPAIAEIAARHVLSRRSWAVVGNGPNRIAARELRIKLSELCYKAIACDATEDKKHIDLSSEPLTLVCAAGLAGSNIDDVGKEVAIYRAHRGAPIVIASEGHGARFGAAADVIAVPQVHPALDFVLSTVAGHIFCYEAALAIDATARPLREARAAVEASAAGPVEELLVRLGPAIEGPAQRFLEGLRAGRYDGSLEASTAVRVASMLRYATGVSPLDAYELEHGKVGTPSTVVHDLTAALTKGIEELTRPIDAIKHQAKTVTVGISRSDETLLHVPLVAAALAAGTSRDGLSYRALRTMVDLDAAVVEVTGFTRYRIDGDPRGADAAVHVVDRGGVAVGLASRTDLDPRLTGTKHRVATQREVTAVRGRRDGRTIVMVPEVKQNQTVGLTLLHVRFADHLPAASMRAVLEGYQGRYSALVDAVTETEATFDDDRLATLRVMELLTEPVYVLAEHWRTR
ncbi:MAG: SIS domain-containing protein [Acidimicrobiia bacterium]|jgi:glucosamine--fructose-6-phosphate aminotransferase (isomerizing)